MGRQRGVAFGDLLLIDLIEFIPNLRNKHGSKVAVQGRFRPWTATL